MGRSLRSAASDGDRPAKRMRRTTSICSCSSPRPPFLSPHTNFNWYEEDIWSEIAKLLDGKSLVMLAVTNRWFHRVIMDDTIWKFVTLRDLQIPLPPPRVTYRWNKLYTSAFNGSHSFMFRQQEKHIDWMRIGAFSLDSSVVLLAERLTFPRNIKKDDATETMLQSHGCCLLDNVRTGIWIADLQLVRCPVCDLNTCDGTMQTLDARHIELFLCEGYQNGSWEYQVVGSHDIKRQANGAAGAIFDFTHMKDSSNTAVFDYSSWIGRPNDWQPKAKTALHAVAVNTNLQENEGLHVKYHAMKAGADGEVVAIRISQQLL
ncbi:putative F-box protein [Senna tora]|uniref:Putative F-box protein n=1 Tax=Senna tora TaxID=362788 RepID=A0A834T7Q3_9FABA|nr:putative F-box protein [Senna tora]